MDKTAVDRAKAERAVAKRVPEPPKTIPMMIDDEEVPSSIPMPPMAQHGAPPPQESLPILLTRPAKDDFEEDTLRIRKKKRSKKK